MEIDIFSVLLIIAVEVDLYKIIIKLLIIIIIIINNYLLDLNFRSFNNYFEIFLNF